MFEGTRNHSGDSRNVRHVWQWNLPPSGFYRVLSENFQYRNKLPLFTISPPSAIGDGPPDSHTKLCTNRFLYLLVLVVLPEQDSVACQTYSLNE
jgi:hypothetical protein